MLERADQPSRQPRVGQPLLQGPYGDLDGWVCLRLGQRNGDAHVGRGSKENRHSGLLQNGKRQGSWVERDADGSRNTHEGPYVDGKEHGPWVDAEGRTIYRYVNGLPQ